MFLILHVSFNQSGNKNRKRTKTLTVNSENVRTFLYLLCQVLANPRDKVKRRNVMLHEFKCIM